MLGFGRLIGPAMCGTLVLAIVIVPSGFGVSADGGPAVARGIVPAAASLSVQRDIVCSPGNPSVLIPSNTASLSPTSTLTGTSTATSSTSATSTTTQSPTITSTWTPIVISAPTFTPTQTPTSSATSTSGSGLGSDRAIEVVEDKTQRTLFECLVHAFMYFDGVAREIKSDNQKVCVDRWECGEPIFNRHYLGFASHYGFRPLAIHPRKPTENLKIERPFYYLETNFLNGRRFRDKK